MIRLFYKKQKPAITGILAIALWSHQASGQSALGQLETWAGRRIDSYSVPAASSPSGSGVYRNPFAKTYEQKQAEAADHYQKALKLCNSKNWEDAIHQLNKAIRKDPYNQRYKDKLREAENSLQKEKQQNQAYQEMLKREEEERKRKEEELRMKEQARLEQERRDQEAIKEKIVAAQEAIKLAKKDIKQAQGFLKNFARSLANNDAGLESWGREVDDAYNRVLDDSKGYLASMFIRYNLLQGVLKRSYIKDLYTRTGNLSNSPNPEIQKWFATELKKTDIRVDEFQDIADRLSLGFDLGELMLTNKEQAGRTLKVLMFMNSLLETAHVKEYDNLFKEVEKPFGLTNMPGEYFEQAKMIGETYSNIGAICFGWFHIRKLNADNAEMANQVGIYSAGMEQKMSEIDCLEKCIHKYTGHCYESCTGKTKWSTPPPPLLFNHRNW